MRDSDSISGPVFIFRSVGPDKQPVNLNQKVISLLPVSVARRDPTTKKKKRKKRNWLRVLFKTNKSVGSGV